MGNTYFSKLVFSCPLDKYPEVELLDHTMALHSSTLAWKIPWTEEPGGLQSMGSLIVGHDWETSLSLFTFMHWRRKWQHTPVFLPGESQGRGAWWAAVYGVAQSRTRLKQQQQQQQQNSSIVAFQGSSVMFSAVDAWIYIPTNSAQGFSSLHILVNSWIFFTNSRSPPKFISIESVMPSNHLILCCPLLLLPWIFPSIKVFSNESNSSHEVAKVLRFQL